MKCVTILHQYCLIGVTQCCAGVILDSVGSLHGATELTGSHDVTTPIIDQITAQQIAGSAMFGTVENMQRGGQERRPAKSSLSQVKYM